PDIEERLISRFSWGLSADLQIPEFETRYAILERKSADNGITIDPKVLEFIAHNFKSNVRDLEGAIIKLLATASLKQVDEIDTQIAKNVLKDMVRSSNTQISIESIQNYVCDYFGIESNRVREKTRKQEVVEARQIAMYLSKKFTKSSLKTIGLHFGGRDHSTVIHAITAIEERASTSPKHQRILRELEQKIELATL
ncbi:MAG TPA: chromosomal replication initiator protein DnaA, partial [Bacteroidetes bacterium]|nr:chromosomal replication initiator protein DnaA [Bacteroidota bacterium]